LKSKKNIVSIIFNEHLIIRAERITIEMEKINGFGYGTFCQELIHPVLSLLVKKEEKNYTAINHKDQRLSSYLEKYDKSTKIEVLVIDNNDVKKIHFIANELLTQMTSARKFSEFFEDTLTNTQNQIWIRDFFAIKSVTDYSNLKFNMTSFSKCFGANAPSLSTLNKIIERNSESEEHPITISDFPSVEAKSNRVLTEEEMRIKWEQHSNSHYPYAHIRKILGPKQNIAFSDRLKELTVKTPEFDDFLRKFLSKIDDRLEEINKLEKNN
jgi:hypothetical protein